MKSPELVFETPIGEMVVIASEQGVEVIDFVERKGMEQSVARCAKRAIVSDVAIQARDQMVEYFAGERKSFDFPLAPTGTPFQNRCWQTLGQIAYGNTISYASQSKWMNHPLAIRAIAQANGQNFRAIVIPCHRVIASNGRMQGYGGGIDRKQWLINHETRYSKTPDSASLQADGR